MTVFPKAFLCVRCTDGRSRSPLALTLLAMLFLLTNVVRAQECNLDGATMEMVGMTCRATHCSNLQFKLVVLGDKVLRYTNSGQYARQGDEGIVYYLGKTIDRNKDSLNKPMQGVMPDEYARVSAEFNGIDLILDERYGLYSRPTDYAETQMIVRISQCNSCRLISYKVSSVYHGKYGEMEFTGGMCHLTRQ